MKKISVLIILVLSILISGCGKKKVEEVAPVKTPETIVEDTDKTEEVFKVDDSDKHDKVTVSDRYGKEGTFEIKYGEEDEGFTYEYVYHIPEINDDSADAKAINDEIYNIAKDSIEVAENMSSGKSEIQMEPEYIRINYDVFENDDIISIVVVEDAVYSDWRDFSIYNYNSKTHKKATNAELLKIAGLSEEEFLRDAMYTLGAKTLEELDYFIESYDANASNEQENEEDTAWKKRMVADFIRYYLFTISENNVNKDMGLYFGDDGSLFICGFVCVPAGAGQYNCVEKLKSKPEGDVLKKYKDYTAKYYYDSFEMDCLGLYELEGYSGKLTHEVASGNSYEDQVYIGFSDKDHSEFLLQFLGDDYSLAYSGTLKWIDCDENGMAFEYELNNLDMKKLPEEEIHKGSFYIKPYGYYDEKIDDYVSGAYYKYIDGEDMLDTKPGEIVNLEKSFG